MPAPMGVVKIVFGIVGLLILAVIGLGAYLYFTDYAAQATITGKTSDGVVVTPKLLPSVHVTEAVPSDIAPFVCVGYQVSFHVNTHAYQVFDRSGTLVYDSATGQKNTAAAVRCAASNGIP
jgi:hypothetical protein